MNDDKLNEAQEILDRAVTEAAELAEREAAASAELIKGSEGGFATPEQLAAVEQRMGEVREKLDRKQAQVERAQRKVRTELDRMQQRMRDVIQRRIYVDEFTYSAAGELKAQREWQLVGSRWERWTVVREGRAWEEWDRMASPAEHLTGPELGGLVATAVRRATGSGWRVMAVTQKRPDTRIRVWAIERGCRFDPKHPLTGEVDKPQYSMRAYRWTRRGRGVELSPHSSDTTAWVYGSNGEAPWEGPYAEKYAKVMLYRNDAMVAEWHEEWARFRDAERFAEPLEQLLSLAVNRLTHRDGYSWHREAQWVVALKMMLEAGEWPQGMTVREVLARGAEMGLRGAYVPDKPGSSTSRWISDAMPDLGSDEEVAEKVVDLSPAEPEPEPEPDDDWYDDSEPPEPEADDDDEREADEMADAILTKVADAIRPEAEEKDNVVASGEGYEVLDG